MFSFAFLLMTSGKYPRPLRQHPISKQKIVNMYQFAVEAEDLFSGIVTDLGEVIDYNPDGEDPIQTIFDYVEAMRCQL